MEEEIQSVTFSEWKLVHRRLDDLENLVTDLKLKLETLEECKCNRRSNYYLETQDSNDEETETVNGLNSQSDLTSAASASRGVIDVEGRSTTQSEEVLTFAEQDTNNTADLKSTASTGSNLGDSTSANTATNGLPVSSDSTSLSNEIGIQDLEKYRRAQVKLTRCDQVEVTGSSSTSEFRITNNNKSTLTSTCKESQISFKKRPVLRRKQNGVRADRTSTPPREKRFVCHICSKRFRGKSNLTLHVRVHTGEKPFHCNVCSKTFNQSSYLKVHTRIHTRNRPFECGFCSKKFIHNSNLKTHTRVHTGDKPYECGFCSKKFSHTQGLTVHVRRHTGERPYTCQFCSKEFAAQGDLINHMKVHTREKPYSCPFCPMVFSHRGNLKRHLTRRHPGETLQAQVQIPRKRVPCVP